MDPQHGQNWSEFLPEILDLILQKLSLPDCFTFGKVCTSWRSVFLDRRSHRRPPPCMMLIPAYHSMPSEALLRTLHEGKFLELSTPRNYFRPGEQIVGYSMGWLVLISEISSDMHLLNPKSNQRISLPSSSVDGDTLMSLNSIGTLHVILSSPPTTSNCILLASGLAGFHCFLLCRPRDREWINVHYIPKYENETLFHKGQLYVCGHWDIDVYSSESEPTTCSLPKNYTGRNWFRRLVESDGELLLVLGGFGSNGYVSLRLDVFKLAGSGEWAKLESLDDRVLLIGEYGAESFRAQDLLGWSSEGNCIYYHVWRKQELVKFSMANGNIETIGLPRDSHGIEWINKRAW